MGELREATRGEGPAVVELANGVTVYPADLGLQRSKVFHVPGRFAADRWRAVWYEDRRRRECQDLTEPGLAARLEKIAVAGSDQVILGACLARLVCCVDRGQAAGDGRYPGPQFGGLDDLDVRAEPQELGLSVLG